MDDRLRVYVFDGSEADLRGRMSQIEAARLGTRWEVVATPSRNQLLDWIERDATASPKRRSAALIDYRTESGDIEQLGFRMIESIRRHAYLWKATRPVIWVDHLTSANVQYAHAVAAEAVIDDAWVDRDPRSALAQVFEWCSARPAAPYPRVTAPTKVFSDAASARGQQQIERRDAVFRRSFGFAPDELDYLILWGMAQAVELQFLDRYCAGQGWAASERAARKARERLQEAMRGEREELDRPEPSNAELARRFLAEAVPGCPDPLSELSWPPFSQVRRLRHDPAILHAAFLEPGAETLLDHFLGVLAGAGDSASSRYESIERALRQVCSDRAAPIALVHGIVHRSCHALSDAFDDRRRFG